MKVRFKKSEPGFWVSGAAHVGLVAVGLVAFSSADQFPDAAEGIPIEVISSDQFSQITKGELSAKEVTPDAKPRVDRVDEKPVEREQAQDKRDAPAPPTRPAEMKTDDTPVEVAAPPPPPPPRPTPDLRREAQEAEAKAAEARAAEARAQARERAVAEAREREEVRERAEAAREAAEARAKAAAAAKAKAEAEAKAKSDAEAKAVAEARAKAEAERRRVAEEKAKADANAKALAQAKAKEEEAKAQRQAQLAQKFNPGDIKSLLQSKEANASQGSTGREVSRTASLGAPTGTSQKLSMSQRDALMGLLREQIERCYQAPISASAGRVVQPVIDIRLNPDGTLSGDPRILRAGAGSTDRAVADAAVRAVRRCAPFRVPAQFAPYYGDWKVLNVEFELPQA